MNELTSFLIVAVAVLQVARGINRANAAFESVEQEQRKGPSEKVLLLREIHDSLQNQA